MEMGLVVALAFGFMCIGCVIGWRAGEQHGLKAATTAFSTQIRQLDAQLNGKTSEIKSQQQSAETAREILEKEIQELKAGLDERRKEETVLYRKLKTEKQRYNMLFEPAKLVAQEQSRSAVVKLQTVVMNIIEQEETARKKTAKSNSTQNPQNSA